MAQTWRRAGSMQKKFTRLSASSASSASLTDTVIIVITWTTCINYVMKIIFERLRVLDLACLVKARQAQVSTCIQFTNPTLRWQVPLPFLQKNDPHRQRTWSRPVLWRNGRFYVLSKSRKWPENPFFAIRPEARAGQCWSPACSLISHKKIPHCQWKAQLCLRMRTKSQWWDSAPAPFTALSVINVFWSDNL